jgi:transposase InsO family protein
MSERIAFVQACLDRTERISDICDRFGISEKTGHKLLRRFKEEGFDGLADRSRARLTHPYRITPEVAGRIIALRRKYPLYGPQTIRDLLMQREPETRWPAASSIGELLKRSNLVHRRRRRSRSAEHAALKTGRARALEPNAVWTADFKGQFRLRGGGSYCYPLTVMDLHSRYLLSCAALGSTAVLSAQKVFTRLFQEHGLPRVLRTDNGVPFCQPNALGRLGKLGFWWVRLGIRPEHTKPATPSENGAHERFHRTLKDATTRPSSQSLESQQRRFDGFRREYNEHRPHRSLPGHRPPAQLYTNSPRPYPRKLPVVAYAEECDVRLVTNGYIKWRNREFFLSSNLAGEYVGLSEVPGDLFTVSYGLLELGHIDATTNRFTPRLQWTGNT